MITQDHIRRDAGLHQVAVDPAAMGQVPKAGAGQDEVGVGAGIQPDGGPPELEEMECLEGFAVEAALAEAAEVVVSGLLGPEVDAGECGLGG